MSLLHYQFANPWFLVLAPVLLGLAVVAWRRRWPTLLVSSLDVFRVVVPARRAIPPPRLPLVLEVAGLGCLIVALARPQFGLEREKVRTEGIDIMIAIDVSGSMDSIDVPSDIELTPRALELSFQRAVLRPRIEVAKEEVRKFIAGRPNDRLGLLAFASYTYTISPPTLDHDFLLANLERLRSRDNRAAEGAGVAIRFIDDSMTNIAAPVANGTARLKDSAAKRRVLVLFTDGRNTVTDEKISPQEAARLARRFDVIVHTVGIGSDRAVERQESPLGVQWVQAPAADLDQQLLEELARETHGRFFLARDARGLQVVMKDIDALERTAKEEPKYYDYRELFGRWLIGGLVLVLLAHLAEHTVFLRTP